MSFIDEIDSYRNPEVVAREKKEDKENRVSTRVIDGMLDISNQLLMASEFAIRMQYNDRANDRQMRDDANVGRLEEQVAREEAHARSGPSSGHSSRRPDLKYRTTELSTRIASPSGPQSGMEFE